MTPSVENPRSTTVSVDAIIYPPLIRLVAGSLVAFSRLSLPRTVQPQTKAAVR